MEQMFTLSFSKRATFNFAVSLLETDEEKDYLKTMECYFDIGHADMLIKTDKPKVIKDVLGVFQIWDYKSSKGEADFTVKKNNGLVEI